MKTIAYIVPYFGKLPELFPFWLNSCRHNTTVDWFLFIDDQRAFEYPGNVHVKYMTFSDLIELIGIKFDYNICLDRPYKLCDFRIAYGEIFGDNIKGYDFWGFCDLDLIWGDIRHFLTEEVLHKFDKIGFQGHSTLVRNTDYYNSLYLHSLKNGATFKEIAQSSDNCMADEIFFNQLCIEKNVPTWRDLSFANLSPFLWNFRLDFICREEKYKNNYFVFEYNNGDLFRVAVFRNKLYRDQYMYVHFLKRIMTINIDAHANRFLIVPNSIIEYIELAPAMVKQYNRPHYIQYFVNHFKENSYKLKWNTILPIFFTKIKGYYRLFLRSNKSQ